MFNKPLAQLTAEDISAIATRRVAEGQEVEFKERLPSKGGQDTWTQDGGEVGPRARDSILREIIAFLNASGGTLLIGVRESDDNPRRAVEICPLPRCHDLAEVLRDQIGTGVEPRLPPYEISGIPTNDGGGGVVAIRVPTSLAGPHRHVHDKEVYVRRRDKSEALTMLEVQALTLSLAKSADQIDARFSARQELHWHGFHTPSARATTNPALEPSRACGLRITAVPVLPIDLGDVHRNRMCPPRLCPMRGKVDGEEYDLELPFFRIIHIKPMLRGTQGVDTKDQRDAWIEIFRDGLIEAGFRRYAPRDPTYGGDQLYIEWILALFGQVVLTIEKSRFQADAPSHPYGIEVELSSSSTQTQIVSLGGHDFVGEGLAGPRLILPRYLMAGRETFGDLSRQLHSDLSDALGESLPPADGLTLDFEAGLSAIDRGTAW